MSNGFTFNGVHSDAFSLTVNSKSIPITPPIESRLQDISGYDGSWDYGVSYQPRPIEIDCTILADSKEDLKMKVRNLAGLLNPRKGAKPIIFDDEPNIVYFARLSNQIPLEQLGAMGTFQLQFVCPDPFTYSVNEKTVSGSSSFVVKHGGTYEALPTLTVTKGNGAATIKNAETNEVITFKDSSPSGTYVIDCKQSTITKDNAAAYNHVTGDFIRLMDGNNRITTTGSISNVSVKFRDTWL